MNGTVEKLIAGTFVVVGLYLLLTNPGGTAIGINSLSGAYDGGVKALQGR